MSEKVKLTKEQAKAIESQLKVETKHDIVWSRLNPSVSYHSEAYPINKMHPDTLIHALYIGYEVEQTPEDKVRELYDLFDPFGVGEEKRVLIKEVLNAYGHAIKGVNA